MYHVVYYFKKYWHLLLLAVVLFIFGIVLFINRGSLISIFDKYENKINLEPTEFTEEDLTDKDYLDKLIVGIPYLGTNSRPYVPSTIKAGSADEEEYIRKEREDQDFVYRKQISWADGSLDADGVTELTELVGYHLNRNSNNSVVIVHIPSTEQLQENEQQVVYYTDDKGVLYLNLSIEEVNEVTEKKKEYFYTYRLKYDMDGKVTIK